MIINKNKTPKNISKETNSFDNSLYYARWIALYDAINMIADEAEQRNKKFENLKLSPVRIKKYIASVEDQIQRKLVGEELRTTIV